MSTSEHPCDYCKYAQTRTSPDSRFDPTYEWRRKDTFPWLTLVMVDDGVRDWHEHLCTRFPKTEHVRRRCGEFQRADQ